MPTTIKDLQAEQNSLNKRLTELDLTSKKIALDKAEKALDLSSSEKLHAQQLATTAKQAAYHAHREAEQARADITDQLKPLDNILSAGQQHTDAMSALAAAQARIDAAQQALDAAHSAQAKMQHLVIEASTAFEQERTEARESLLKLVAAGSDTSKVKAANRDKLTNCEAAQVLSDEAVTRAQAAMDAANSIMEEAQQKARIAAAAGTALTHELALRDYLPVFLAHRKAYFAAYSHEFPTPRFDIFAIDAERTE